MDGLEASEIKHSNLSPEFRIDSEYYKKAYLREDRQRARYGNKKLGEVAFITDGQHGYHEVDESSPILLLTAKNAKNWFADSIGTERIAQWVDDKNRRSSLRRKDIILSTRGSIGYCALVESDVLPANIDQDVARIAIERDVLPEFALTYLNSIVGQDWMRRNATGMVQQGLPLAKVRDLPIPVLSDEVQSTIKKLIHVSHMYITKGKANYIEAEGLLLEELGLKNWQPQKDTIAVNSFAESFGGTNRLDAEFYEPRFIELESKLRRMKSRELATLVAEDIKRGVQPVFVEGGDVYVVASKAVRPAGVILDEEECTDRQFYEEKKTSKARLKKGDVLLNGTGRGTLGRASVYDSNRLAVADNHVTIIRTKEEVCDPYYLMLYLNSFVGQWQSERYQCGSSGQLELYPDQIGRFLIYIPPQEGKNAPDLQQRISSLVKESFAVREQSKAILTVAKRGVEIAIEQDETAALAWMEEQTRQIGLS